MRIARDTPKGLGIGIPEMSRCNINFGRRQNEEGCVRCAGSLVIKLMASVSGCDP